MTSTKTNRNVVSPTDVLWALIGLVLTISGTFIEAYSTNAPWNWAEQGLQAYSLGVNYQIGAVLLVGCLGGRTAAVLSQIAYLSLGLLWFPVFGVPVFDQGGGLHYVREPSFGYLLGFIPAAWVCGSLAARSHRRLEALAFSCLCGLLSIHVLGLTYLVLNHALGWGQGMTLSLIQAILVYSIYRLPGQIAVVCMIAVLAFVMRHLMFY